MTAFAWQRRKTRHFGEQWAPFADLSLQSASGRWYLFSMLIDTGAVVSVLSPSAAQVIGIAPGSGEPIDMAGISAPPRRYFLHRLSARMGAGSEFSLRLAVAERDDAPSLLGRLDVLDRFRMELDPLGTSTWIGTPTLRGNTM